MNYAKAQQYLDALKDLALDKGRVYQEQGHLYRAQGLTSARISRVSNRLSAESCIDCRLESTGRIIYFRWKFSCCKAGANAITTTTNLPNTLLRLLI